MLRWIIFVVCRTLLSRFQVEMKNASLRYGRYLIALEISFKCCWPRIEASIGRLFSMTTVYELHPPVPSKVWWIMPFGKLRAFFYFLFSISIGKQNGWNMCQKSYFSITLIFTIQIINNISILQLFGLSVIQPSGEDIMQSDFTKFV